MGEEYETTSSGSTGLFGLTFDFPDALAPEETTSSEETSSAEETTSNGETSSTDETTSSGETSSTEETTPSEETSSTVGVPDNYDHLASIDTNLTMITYVIFPFVVCSILVWKFCNWFYRTFFQNVL